jgi:pyrimidine 5'-nucleotidase
MEIDTILFDLDSTLYPEENGLWQAIRARIDLYMSEVMGFKVDEIPKIRNNFLNNHGTTLKGLQIHYKVDPSDYLTFVHDLPLENFLSKDTLLLKILNSIPLNRWIFTNADINHALRVISALGITDCFEGIIDIWKLEPYCKPQPTAYLMAMDFVGCKDPGRYAIIDDSSKNIATAKSMGFFSIQVGRNLKTTIGDRKMDSIHELPEIVPEFWR